MGREGSSDFLDVSAGFEEEEEEDAEEAEEEAAASMSSFVSPSSDRKAMLSPTLTSFVPSPFCTSTSYGREMAGNKHARTHQYTTKDTIILRFDVNLCFVGLDGNEDISRCERIALFDLCAGVQMFVVRKYVDAPATCQCCLESW